MSATGHDLPTGAIRFLGLRVAFQGREVVRGVDLEVPPGLVTVVIGRSGSGKTTLLRAVNRLNECFPGCATRGRVTLGTDDGPVDAYAPGPAVEDLRRMVGMVFQSPNVLPMSVRRNMLMPMRLVLGADGDAEGRMRLALEEAGLWEEVGNRLGASALTLSGGQQQRLCLARALALEPRFLLLDEPTASLDYRASLQLEAMIRSQKLRRTLLVVSHSLGQARRLADRMVVMRDGRVARVLERDELDACGSLDDMLETVF